MEGSKDLTTDRNSNNATELCIDDDIGNDGGRTNVDGAVFGKEKINRNGMKLGEEKMVDEGQKAKEDLGNERGKGLAEMETKKENGDRAKGKRKDDKDKEVHEKKKEREEKRKEKGREKEVKDKERSQDSRSKRSHTSPPERPEPKPVPKMSLSVKASSSTANTSDERKMSKKEKKKSKKPNIDSPPASPPPFASATNRNSFMHRELPKRPSEEFDTDDGNYEPVIPQGPPRDPKKLMVPSANPRVSASGDSDVYDSVDDVQVASGSTAGDDTYETVDTKLSKSTASNKDRKSVV